MSKTVKFYSQFNRPPRVCRSFSEEVPVFSLIIENDKPKLKEVGKTNYQESIECSCSYHSVKQLIERFKRGDISALNSKSGFFADISSMPDSIFAARKVIDSTFSVYDSLDKELKNKFGSYESFLKSFSDNSYIKVFEEYNSENLSKKGLKTDVVPDMQSVPPVQAGEKKSEVKVNE